MLDKERFHWVISKNSIKSKITRQSPEIYKIDNCPAGTIFFAYDEIFAQDNIVLTQKFAEDKKSKNGKIA